MITGANSIYDTQRHEPMTEICYNIVTGTTVQDGTHSFNCAYWTLNNIWTLCDV